MSDIAAKYFLCLFEEHALAGVSGVMQLGSCNRIVYVVEGVLMVDGETVAADQAIYSPSSMQLAVGEGGARWLRWELLTTNEPELPTDLPMVNSALKTNDAITTVDVQADWLMRCDSVAFPPGGCAFTHTHQGPGIRYLLDGTIRIDTLDESTPLGVGSAWYESGPHPVFAQADAQLNTRFVRVMVLPPELAGKSSISYVNADDLDKPKSQTYHRYCEQTLQL